jgi:hypothetical protein
LTAGTLFQGTRKPLLLWFHIMWWVVAQKTGVSASNMQDFMGFDTYRGKLFYRLMQQSIDIGTVELNDSKQLDRKA